MNFSSNDKKAYILSKIIGKLDTSEAGTDFLRKYWIKTGKLKYTQKLLGETFSFAEDETQYLLNIEYLCQRLMNALNEFLREPYCFGTQVDIEPDTTVKFISSELITKFESLKKISLNYGWQELYKSFSEAVLYIESTTSRLIAMQKSEKCVCFYTNITEAEDFLDAKQIDFRQQRGGKYFVMKQ